MGPSSVVIAPKETSPLFLLVMNLQMAEVLSRKPYSNKK